MSTETSPTKYKTGVSLEPEVVRSLDELAAVCGVNRSRVLNTIVREYLRLTQDPSVTLPTREAPVIQFN